MLTPLKRGQNVAEIPDNAAVAKRRLVGHNGQCRSGAFESLCCMPRSFYPDNIEMIDCTASSNPSENICYGALCDAQARVSCSKRLASLSLPWRRYNTFKLVARGEYYHLVQESGTNTEDIGMLDLVTTESLHSLETFTELLFTAVLASSNLDGGLRKAPRKQWDVDISVNITGPEGLADGVGDVLDNAGKYLQHPCFLKTGIQYINPQYFYPDSRIKDLRELIGPPTIDSSSTRVSERIKSLLESPTDLSSQIIPSEDQRISSAAIKKLILTPLKRHQEDGLRFILSREDPTFSDSAASDVKALVGSRFFPNKPTLSLGGIVADVMGLGKTLTMLSAVVCSKNVAREALLLHLGVSRSHARLGTPLGPFSHFGLQKSLTFAEVLNVWISEMEKHLKSDTLRFALFHGDSRAQSPEALVEYDVVLTTYHTLAFDWKGRRVLQRMAWYRVVLDEAHWIRNQSSERFKAAESLQSERRWCLTGTPFQNSLDDVRSLLRFLHFQPFADQTFFEKHIIKPLRLDTPDSFRNLKLLLQTICLRRNTINLYPPACTEEILITLTNEETAAYDRILADCRSVFDRIVSTKSEIKRYNVIFTTIVKLRQLCNHGTLQVATSCCITPSGKKKISEKRAIPTNGAICCELCSGEDEDAIALLSGLEVCPDCSRCLQVGGASLSQPSGNGLSSASSPSSRASSSPASRDIAEQSLSPTPPSFSSVLQTGHSSKLIAVVNNIQKSVDISKSLVFTSWRSTLDILANMLTNRGIPWLKIDGRVSFSDRQEILSRFCGDDEIRVLLLSIGTGAVGLTLTAANYVHIVEPQWNPSVEEQAIARVLRMGQTRAVTVFKYVTEKTVEQNILTLQKQKSLLAKFSLDGGTDANAMGRLDDLKFVLDTGE